MKLFQVSTCSCQSFDYISKTSTTTFYLSINFFLHRLRQFIILYICMLSYFLMWRLPLIPAYFIIFTELFQQCLLLREKLANKCFHFCFSCDHSSCIDERGCFIESRWIILRRTRFLRQSAIGFKKAGITSTSRGIVAKDKIYKLRNAFILDLKNIFIVNIWGLQAPFNDVMIASFYGTFQVYIARHCRHSTNGFKLKIPDHTFSRYSL